MSFESLVPQASRLADECVLECRICWYRYDPSLGDPVWQVLPGTPFDQLPAYWSCPQCDAPASYFLPVP